MKKIEFALKFAKDCTYADIMTEGAKEHLRNVIDEALKELKTKEEEVEEEINKVLDEESQKHYKSFMNEIEDKFMGIKPKEDE
tara:strand:+ start:554 stop:802 length:249 start_codon:yes stop_codon:yes gene_type:complete